jgi:glycosyltransferase involved in cell wall biosynthesis
LTDLSVPLRRQGTPAPTLLIMSNYSNRTGYAWRNIHRLFNRVGEAFLATGVGVAVSFRELEPPVDCLDPELGSRVLELDPDPRTPGSLLRLLGALRAENVRFLYLTDQRSVSLRYALFRLAGVRRILVHNRVSVPDPSRITVPDRSIRGLVKWMAARLAPIRADRTYAVSDFVRDRLVLKGRLPRDRAVTILNGIDVEAFASPPRQPREGVVRIFAGSRASRFKGIQVLIQAAARLRETHGIEDFLVTYAGDGPDLKDFRDLADSLGLSRHVRFLGEVPSTQEFVADSDIVVVPSIWGDACPSSVSEALASGAAVVATTVGGVPEIVGSGDNALLVPPDDVVAMTDALAHLISNAEARDRVARNGSARAWEALDQDRYHSEVIERMLEDCGILLGEVQS